MAGTGEPVAGWLVRVVRLHDDIIERYGGAKGLTDVRLLEAALQRPFIGLADGTEFFPTDIEKAAALLEGLIAFHAFMDGNKRTATIFTFEFLREQGYILHPDPSEIPDVVVRIATHDMSLADVRRWLTHITSR